MSRTIVMGSHRKAGQGWVMGHQLEDPEYGTQETTFTVAQEDINVARLKGTLSGGNDLGGTMDRWQP